MIVFVAQQNKRVVSLNLEDDDVGPDGAVHIADMLKENDTITEVVSRVIFSFIEVLLFEVEILKDMIL